MKTRPCYYVLGVCLVGLNAFVREFARWFDFPRAELYFKNLCDCSKRMTSLESCYRDHGGLCPDSFLRHFSGYDFELVVHVCNVLLAMSFSLLKTVGWNSKSVYAAIDYNEVEYWGEMSEWVHKVLGKKIKGSSRVLRYATLAIVSRNFKFTIACLPVKRGEGHDLVVGRLLDLAAYAGIDTILLDRGFYNAGVIKAIQHRRMGYILIAKKSKKLKKLYMESRKTGRWDWLYEMNKGFKNHRQVHLYMKEDPRHEYMGVISNRPVSPADMDMLFQAYRKRWNIENSYKERKQFHVKTSSKNPAYRYLAYCVSLLIVNLMQLARKKNNAKFTKANMKKLLSLLLKGVTGIIELGRNTRAIISTTFT